MMIYEHRLTNAHINISLSY